MAGLGLALALTAAAGAAVPANAASKDLNRDDTSLEALVEWLETHELQDWLNYLALTNPPRSAPNSASGAGQSGASHAPPPTGNNQAGTSGTGATHAPPRSTLNRSTP